MYRIIQIDQDLAFESGSKQTVKGLSVAVRLQDGAEVPLRMRSLEVLQGEKTAQLASYANEEETVSLQLKMISIGDHLVVHVSAAIRNKELFRDIASFAPDGGITLRLKEIPGITGLMANYQHKDWWTRPHFDTALNKLPAKTVSLLWQTKDTFHHMLPVCDKQFRSDLAGGNAGVEVRISAYQGGFDRCETVAFVVGSGNDPYRLSEGSVGVALDACGSVARPRKDKVYPEILDYLGWCSWDAFYHEVNASGLLQKTAEFAQSGLPVRWVMIDDGWSGVREKRLATYDAVKEKFPGGLSSVIGTMKSSHSIRWVGVWHTIAGYWGGIDPEGELFERNRSRLYRTNNGAWVPAPDAEKAFGFWNDWHSYLKRQGVDFVKVDSQSAVTNFFRSQASIGEAAKAAHTALEASVGLHFGGCVINCMGMAPENVWHRPSSSLSRNSDDFMPQEKHGFREHALQNAYNSFYHGHFYWGDWDMYWTRNHDDVQNMVLRSVSGGPVYFSDKPGETNAANVWPLVYRDGRIIRCELPGQPTADCLMADPSKAGVPLKLWNRSGESGVIAAFHVHEADHPVEGSFGPSDVPGLEGFGSGSSSGSGFWVYEHFGKKLFRMTADERIPLRLNHAEAALYLMIPARKRLTPVGLIDKLVSVDAVASHCEAESAAGSKSIIRLKEGGLFAFAALHAPVSVTVNGSPSECKPISGQSNLYTVDCAAVDSEVLIEAVFA